MGQAQVHKAGPDIEKALDPVLVFIHDKQIDLKLWCRYFEHFGQTSKPDMHAGCLLGFGKLLCIFKN